MIAVLMGVSGSGKTTIGLQLQTWLFQNGVKCTFVEGDDYHSKENIRKMTDGIPLSDLDRIPWLYKLKMECMQYDKDHQVVLVSCSALKKKYRDYLRCQQLCFLHLEVSPEEVERRLLNRNDHFFNKSLITSQFDTLEVPDHSESDVYSISDFVQAKIFFEKLIKDKQLA